MLPSRSFCTPQSLYILRLRAQLIHDNNQEQDLWELQFTGQVFSVIKSYVKTNGKYIQNIFSKNLIVLYKESTNMTNR